MKIRICSVCYLVVLGVLLMTMMSAVAGYKYKDILKNKPHSMDVDPPEVVQPGQDSFIAPSDAIVLFGKKVTGDNVNDLSQWISVDNTTEAQWDVMDDYFVVKPKTGDIRTRGAFGSIQLHIEWASPVIVKGRGQGRGNSGIFLMGLYEIQVLDSYQNRTYADGQAASLYGQYPPLVNVSREPGEWQSYDIIFHAPEFDEKGKYTSPATVTVLHNGILVQDNMAFTGPTSHKRRPEYKKHAEKLSLVLQDHGDLVKYRNIWIRDLDE